MNINHTKMELEINSCKNYEILEVRQGDKNSRIIDFTFTVNGEVVDLTSAMSATVNATVDNVIVADNVAAVVDTDNNVVTVTLTDTMLALAGVCKMDIVLTEGDEIITAETVCLRIGKSVINGDSKAFPGASSISEITREVTTARGDYDNLGQRLDELIPDEQGFITTFNLANGAVTTPIIADGAVDASKLSQPLIILINNISNKADKGTTLAEYGITDAYTKDKTNSLLKNKLDSMPFDTVPKLNSPCYLTSGTVYNALTDKYDSSNIEYGTATLTPYSTQTDKVKTASCEYKKIGNTVIANVHLVMNECAVGSNAVLHLLNMPFKGARITRCLGVSSANNYVCKGQITTAAWFQLVNTSKTTMSFSADEEVDFTVNYKILGA